MVVDGYPGSTGSSPACREAFGFNDGLGTVFGDRLFFSARSPEYGRELWVTDGTAAGTKVLLDLAPGRQDSNPRGLVVLRDRLFFTAEDGQHGSGLWASDGTREGTYMVSDVAGGDQVWAVGDRLFCPGGESEHGSELWTSDGTPGGTHLVADIVPGGDGSFPVLRGTAAGLIFFNAFDKRFNTRCLFRSNGSQGGTIRLNDGNSHGQGGAALNGRFFFSGAGGLWASDGSPAGTTLVKELDMPAYANPANEAVVARGRLFFGATDGQHGQALWVSDGTAEGTRMVRELGGTPIYALTALGDLVAFQGNDGVHGNEPWLSDGTPDGTRLAADVTPGLQGIGPDSFALHRGHVFFTYSGGLWVLTESP